MYIYVRTCSVDTFGMRLSCLGELQLELTCYLRCRSLPNFDLRTRICIVHDEHVDDVSYIRKYCTLAGIKFGGWVPNAMAIAKALADFNLAGQYDRQTTELSGCTVLTYIHTYIHIYIHRYSDFLV